MRERLYAVISVEGNRRECGVCGVWMSKANYTRRVRTCGVSEVEGTVKVKGTGGRTRGRVLLQ